MASDDKKTKAKPAHKNEATAKEKSAPGNPAKPEAAPMDKSAPADPAKPEGGKEAGGVPAGYSRGEGQKPVSQAYKDNWNAIFAKKKKR